MLLVYLLLLSVICCVTVVTIQVNLSVYEEKLYEKSVQELDFFVGRVNDSLADVESFSYNLSMSVEMQERLSAMKALNHLEAQYSYERYQLQSRLTSEVYTNPIVKSITYTDLYNNEVVAGEYTGSVDQEDYAGLLETMHRAHGGYVTLAPSEDYPYLLSGRDILKHIDHSMDYLGTYIIACDVAGVIEARMGALSAAHSTLFVYGPRGMIFQDGEKIPVSPDSEQGYEIARMDGQLYFLCWLTDRETDWTYLNSFPYSEIYGQITRLRYTIFGIFAVMFALSVLIMRRLARSVTQPLQTLTRSMQVVETGDFKAARAVLPEQTSADETGQLTQEFRVMLEKIDLLIYENYEKQLLLQEMRYQMLQAQINPHFLNNTLNTVAWLVKAGKNDDANKVIVGVWQFGSAMLIFLAALKQIPESLYESASIDGASPRRTFWSITMPMLTPTIFFNLILQIINGFRVFTETKVVTNGGPMNSTLSYVLYMYQKAFNDFDMGYSCALGWVLVAIIGVATILLFKSQKKWVHYEA